MKEFGIMKRQINALVATALCITLVSGCSLFRNPETEAEQNEPRLLDDSSTTKTWYCYGQDEDSWDCQNERNPSLVKKIEPAPPSSPAPVEAPATAPAAAMIEPPAAQEPEQPASDPLLSQPADYYAVQLIALQDEDGVVTYARTNGITEPLYTEIETDGTRWYVLLLGVYPDQSSAQAAREDWERTKALKVKPWIRRLGPLQQAIRTARAET